ncbi:MAG: discoidin domain-containing protein [Paenibacillaceae bacterium]
MKQQNSISWSIYTGTTQSAWDCTNGLGNVTGTDSASWSIDYFRAWKNNSLPAPQQPPIPAPGANLAPYGYTSTVGIPLSHYRSFPPYNLNDENVDTYYRTPTNSSFPAYIYLDWTTPQTINTVTLKTRYSKDRAPTNYDIEYSADGRFGWQPIAQNITPNWQFNDCFCQYLFEPE